MIIPNMGIGAKLISTTHQDVQRYVLSRTDQYSYQGQFLRSRQLGSGAIQREFGHLVASWTLAGAVGGGQACLQANRTGPAFEGPRRPIRKTLGVAHVLESGLAVRADKARPAFLRRSMATDGKLLGGLSMRDLIYYDLEHKAEELHHMRAHVKERA
jgi:hypothetical protein